MYILFVRREIVAYVRHHSPLSFQIFIFGFPLLLKISMDEEEGGRGRGDA
jgi:hypothetical protein